jgi:hypothetical protein
MPIIIDAEEKAPPIFYITNRRTKNDSELNRARKELVKLVMEVAKFSKSHDALIASLEVILGTSLEELGSGAGRFALALPHELVLKCSYYVGSNCECQNDREVEIYRNGKHRNYTTKVFAHCKTEKVNIVIAERAHNVGDFDRQSPQYQKLDKLFCDAYGTNVGWVGNKMVLVDPGCGLNDEY